MNCKFCNAEMEEEVTLCPVCGKDNAAEEVQEPAAEAEMVADEMVETTEETFAEEATETVAEEAAEEELDEAPADRKKMSAGKLAAIYIAVLAVIVALVAFVLTSLGENTDGMGAVDQNVTEAVEYTTPGRGNKDDVTCKGSYTVSDKKAKSKSGKVIATVGDTELTNADLQVYYWMQVYNYLDNYGDSGLDTTRGLDTQLMTASPDGWTYQQYLLDAALNNWHMYYTFCQEAEAAGFEMDEEIATYLDGLAESVESLAANNGFENADALLQHDMGPGVTLDAYLNYMHNYYYGYSYYNSLYETIVPTEEQINAFFDENAADFTEQGILKDDSVYVNVRHILLQPAGDSDDAKEACKVQAETLLDQWLSGDKTEDSFAELANANSTDPGSNTNGGLYEYVYEGQMMTEFNDWCFDSSRQYGDYGIVETSYGYHLMFFCESIPVWYAHAESGATNELLNETIDELMAKYPVDFKYSKMVLGFVDLAG